MNKLFDLTLVGLCMVLAGITMLMSENIGVEKAKVIVPILFAIAGILSFFFSKANKQHKIASQFQLFQGIGLVIYSLVIAFLPKDLGGFLMYTTYFIMLFGLFEISFSFLSLDSSGKIIKEILLFRIIGGFITAIGALVLLLTSLSNEYHGLMIAGALTIIIGLSNIIFASKLKLFLKNN